MDNKKKITIQAAVTKEKTENKVNRNRVYKLINKPVDTEILNVKKQESMLRKTVVDIKIVKKLGKAGYILVTLADKRSQLKSIPLYDQGQEYDIPPYKHNPNFLYKMSKFRSLCQTMQKIYQYMY